MAGTPAGRGVEVVAVGRLVVYAQNVAVRAFAELVLVGRLDRVWCELITNAYSVVWRHIAIRSSYFMPKGGGRSVV